MKQGLRQNKLAQNKKTKQHIKSFYKILGDMDVVAKQLDPTLEYTEENINEYILPIYGRELDNMEKFLVLGKMHQAKEMINGKEESNI
jgi:hypothetical protein